MVSIRKYILQRSFKLLLIVSIHAHLYAQDFQAGEELAIVKKQKAQVLLFDSGRLNIAGYLPIDELINVEKNSDSFYVIKVCSASFWNYSNLTTYNQRRLFIKKQDLVFFDEMTDIQKREIINAVLDSVGYYFKNRDNSISKDILYVDSLEMSSDEYDTVKKEWNSFVYYDSVTRMDFYFTHYFQLIEQYIMSFIFQTRDSILLVKYASTIECPLGGAEHTNEIFGHLIVSLCYCDLEFLIKSLNSIIDKKEKIYLKKEIFSVINSYWGDYPYISPFSNCPGNLYTLYHSDNNFIRNSEEFMKLKTKILKRIQNEIKD